MILTIGRRLRRRVASFADASALYVSERQRSNEGASTFPVGILDNGHYVSYNGKVWAGKPLEWRTDATPVFNPYATADA